MLATGAVSAVSGGRDDVLLRRLRGLSTSRDDLLNFGKTESWIMRDPATRRETRYEAYSDPPRSTSRSERCCDFWREDSSLHTSLGPNVLVGRFGSPTSSCRLGESISATCSL